MQAGDGKAAFDMHSGARRHRRRQAAPVTFAAVSTPTTPWLVAATDLGLLGALVLVPGCLGGRTPNGQLILVLVALWTAVCWSLHRLTAAESKWTWSGAEPLWLAGIALAGLQLAELPPAWLAWLSPQHAILLGTDAFRIGDEVLWEPWRRLSLAPTETASGLANFLAYGMLFFVAVQRVEQRRDAERLLKGLVLIAVGWAAFSLVHFYLGNGKFYWTIVHPQVSTTSYNTGPFITRNHFAHFLALASGPLLWWWLTSSGSSSAPQRGWQSGFDSPASPPFEWRQLVFTAATIVLVLAAVLTLSRGGLAALLIAMFITLVALQRVGSVSGSFVLGLAAAGVLIGGLGWAVGGEALTRRIDGHGPELRSMVWQANLELAKSFPWFGTGVGTHESAHRLHCDLSERNQVFTHAESCYLQVLSECGLAGLALALLMTVLVVWWPLRVLGWAEQRQDRAMAAALLGSLAGHLAHATVDFLWYAPGCMVVIVLLAAIGRRLSQWQRGPDAATWTLPPLSWGLSAAGVLFLGVWMLQQKLPAAAAESSTEQYRLLSRRLEDPLLAEDPEEELQLQQDRIRMALRAVQADPGSSKWLAIATAQQLRLFDMRQKQGDNPMSLLQLRDAVRVSEFDSAEAVQDWIQRATGRNHKWLEIAWRTALRSLREDPLEGRAYLHLARLSFLRDPSGEFQRVLIERALRVRPHDAEVLLAAGEEALLWDDVPQAVTHWRQVFPRGKTYQQRIARMLVDRFSPQDFVDSFQPDWRACEVLYRTYAESGLVEHEQEMLRVLADAAVVRARQSHDADSVSAWIMACTALRELGEEERALDVLHEAYQRDPNQYEIRRALGGILMLLGRYGEAAPHLRWAAVRRPQDTALRKTAELAVRESHRTTPPEPPTITPAVLTQPATDGGRVR
jgi:O-antigen ligase/tetratricopeptide (TPR) repeat protein